MVCRHAAGGSCRDGKVGAPGILRRIVAGITVPVLMTFWTEASGQEMPPLPAPKPEAATRMVTSGEIPLPGVRPEPPERDRWAMLYGHDGELYRRIFSAQQFADWQTADRLIAGLNDRLLMGHVLAQRYLHPTGWISSYDELSTWLDSFADHPDARRIWRLALRRQPEGARSPVAPKARWSELAVELSGVGESPDTAGSGSALDRLSKGERDFLKRIRADVRKGRYSAARARLSDPDVLAMAGPLALDMAAGEVAYGFFIHGDDHAARETAGSAIRRSGHQVPLAGWTAGLAAWRQGDPAAARAMFAQMSHGDPEDPLVAANAWWAARLSLLTGNPEGVGELLGVAARQSRSIYGLLARHALGMDAKLVNDLLPDLSDADLDALSGIPAMRRAVALAQVGQHHRGDREFNGLDVNRQFGIATAVITLAGEFGFPATLYRLSREFLSVRARRFDDALYPLPPWEPVGGFEVEPALIYAVMRQESNFRAFTVSHARARGVMQIMPSTAAFISGDGRFDGPRRHLLNDPYVSVELGQRYVRHLLELPVIDGNLFLLLAAYNGGPGKLAKRIRASGAPGDPLLFVESYPSRETRSFIRNVMADYWIYSLRLGSLPATLDMVAAGDWPILPDGDS